MESYDQFLATMKSEIKNVSYALLAFTVVVGLAVLSGWCYRESTIDRTFEEDQKLLREYKAQKAEELRQSVQLANKKKRDEYKKKYPDAFKDEDEENQNTKTNPLT